jgi:O-antigen/teichoic acid export membrane protein
MLLGLIKGRRYFRSYSDEKTEYLFHSVNVTLTLAGLAVTAIALFVGLGLENLKQLSSIILFFSMSFVTLALSSSLAKLPRRAYNFIGDVLADMGVLAIGCGFLIFFEHELPSSYALTLTYSLFIAFFLILSLLDLYKYYKYWSVFNDVQEEKTKASLTHSSNGSDLNAN